MSTENQNPNGASPAGTGTEPPVKDAATLQAEINALRAQVEEKQQAAEFWKKKADAAPAPPAKLAAAEEDDLDVLDAIASKGAKGFEEIASKRGFIRKDEVEKLIDAKANNIAREQQLLKQYPDLGKKDSDFFKVTAQHYGDLVKQGVSEAVATQLAAEKTELQFIREGKMKTPTQQAEEEREQRRARAMASGADFGRAAVGGEEDEPLTSEQKHIASRMGISEADYIKYAKAGVQVRGR